MRAKFNLQSLDILNVRFETLNVRLSWMFVQIDRSGFLQPPYSCVSTILPSVLFFDLDLSLDHLNAPPKSEGVSLVSRFFVD